MLLAVKKVDSESEKRKFIRLPWKIYNNYPQWVPPLLNERKKFLDADANPFFEHAKVDLFLAQSNNREPVGRIALIRDRSYNDFHSENVCFFGLFECIDDQKTANLLLDTAIDWCRAEGADKLIGPMNLSTNHECGLLVEGFDIYPMIGIPFNPPYYSKLLTDWGLKKSKDLLSMYLHPRIIPQYLEKATVKLKKRNHFSIRPLRLDAFEKEIDLIWDVYNSAWSRNWGFVPMTQKEFFFAAREMKSVVLPDLCFIAEKNNEPVGFSLSLPNMNEATKSMNGKLLPVGLVKYLLNRKKISSYRVLTLGVKKKYQRLGIDAIFYYETYKWLVEHNADLVEMSWLLEDNQAILAPMYRMNGKIYKRHRIYERECLH